MMRRNKRVDQKLTECDASGTIVSFVKQRRKKGRNKMHALQGMPNADNSSIKDERRFQKEEVRGNKRNIRPPFMEATI